MIIIKKLLLISTLFLYLQLLSLAKRPPALDKLNQPQLQILRY